MAMTTYETKLRGARNRLVVALGEAKEPEAISSIETMLRLVNRLINPQESNVAAEAD